MYITRGIYTFYMGIFLYKKNFAWDSIFSVKGNRVPWAPITSVTYHCSLIKDLPKFINKALHDHFLFMCVSCEVQYVRLYMYSKSYGIFIY